MAAEEVRADGPSADSSDARDLMKIYCSGNLNNDSRYKIDYYSYHIDLCTVPKRQRRCLRTHEGWREEREKVTERPAIRRVIKYW